MWFLGPFTSYGLGWNVNDYRGNKEVSHLGGGLGQHCLIAMLPEQRVGLVVLTNLGGHQLPRALALRVFDAYLGHSSTDWSAELLSRKRTAAAQSDAREAQLAAARARATRPSLPVISYAGTYTHPGFGDIQVTAEGDTLGLRFGVNTSNLEHWQYDVYRYRLTWMTTPEPQLFVRFRLGTAGRVEDLMIEDVGVFTRR